jgi:hypothetical protein
MLKRMTPRSQWQLLENVTFPLTPFRVPVGKQQKKVNPFFHKNQKLSLAKSQHVYLNE